MATQTFFAGLGGFLNQPMRLLDAEESIDH
jgi:hypothetical protein